MSNAVLPFNLGFNDYEMRMDYTTDSPPAGQPSYQGFAAPGTPTSQASWIVYKFSYTGNDMTLRQVKFKITYDSRGSAF